MRRALFVTLLACGCGGGSPAATDAHTADAARDAGPDVDEGAVSGSRLKLTWFNFADGTRTWNSFYDAQRKENCSLYSGWAGGGTFCVPDWGGNIFYNDAGCAQPVDAVYHDPSCLQTPPTYVIDGSDVGCTYEPQHLYLRGPQLTITGYYERFSDGSCGGPYTGGYDFYQLGAEIPTSELVEITLGAPTTAGRLSTRFYQSTDGMKVPASVHDAMLGTDCYPESYGDNATTATCQPSTYGSFYYHDAACTQPELDVPTTCAVPQYMSTTPTTACPADPPNIYTLGQQLASSPLYYPSTGSCVSTTGSTDEHYYQTGMPVNIATMARIADTTPGHRIELVHFTTTDGLKFRDYVVHDVQEDADCYPTQLPDGTIRCVPYGGYVDSYFSNAQCTAPLDVVPLSTGPATCGQPAVPKFARKYVQPQPGTCQYSTELHPVTTPYTGTVYYNNGVSCAVLTTYQQKFYSIGPAVPLTDFVSATLSTDQ